MSWSIGVQGKVNTILDDARAKFSEVYKEPPREVEEQFNRAIDSLLLILPSVQPDIEGVVSVSLSGHANREHKKDPAWANDMVSVSVYQL
jgi:hypothetical protein